MINTLKNSSARITLVILLVITLGGFLILFKIQKDKQESRIQDASNLKAISTAMYVYSTRNNYFLPDSVSLLIEERYIPLSRSLTSPILGKFKIPRLSDISSEDWDYVYLGKGVYVGKSNKYASGKLVVMHTRLKRAGQPVNFLFSDGHVESLDNVTDIKETVQDNGWFLPNDKNRLPQTYKQYQMPAHWKTESQSTPPPTNTKTKERRR